VGRGETEAPACFAPLVLARCFGILFMMSNPVPACAKNQDFVYLKLQNDVIV
jgi:hypothetical protein